MHVAFIFMQNNLSFETVFCFCSFLQVYRVFLPFSSSVFGCYLQMMHVNVEMHGMIRIAYLLSGRFYLFTYYLFYFIFINELRTLLFHFLLFISRRIFLFIFFLSFSLFRSYKFSRDSSVWFGW